VKGGEKGVDFDKIYQLYFKDVFIYIRSLSINEDVAEEITQETFVKALKSIDNFDGSKDIRAWLFTIAKNTYFTYYKRQKIFADSEVPDEIPSIESSLVDHFLNEESAFLIHRFLHSMDEPYKEVFSLRVFGELPFEKIGEPFRR
jgi:RNA polymerase sigma-70 factor (ECF subfamily)